MRGWNRCQLHTGRRKATHKCGFGPVLYCKTGQVTNPSEPKGRKAKVSREVKVRETIKTSRGRTKFGRKIV